MAPGFCKGDDAGHAITENLAMPTSETAYSLWKMKALCATMEGNQGQMTEQLMS
jgi:hypothetical protein